MAKRRFDRARGDLQIGGDRIGQQRRKLAHQPAKIRDRSVLRAQQTELRLHEGMIDHENVWRRSILFGMAGREGYV